MALRALSFAAVVATGLAFGGASPRPSAAELRRYVGSADCTGQYTVLSSDLMGTCTPFLIPAPASVRVEYVNETTYSSYHYQGVQDCSGASRRHLMDLVVNSCTNEGGYSQKRVWIMAPSPPAGPCAAPGDCGLAYQACCIGLEATGTPCECRLHNGSGTDAGPGCGACGKAFVACCSAAGLVGYPCTCDVTREAAPALVV